MITRRIQYEMAGRVVGPLLMNIESMQKKLKGKRKPRDNPFGPPLQAVKKLKEIMSIYYLQGRYADGAVPVAWVTSGFPVEMLAPLGFFSIYPENHAAMCGVTRSVVEMSDAAEKVGYSRDLCSYARTDFGCVLTGKTPVGRLPKPDLLACCSNICQTVLYWYRNLAEYFNVPLVIIDTPFVYGQSPDHHTQYVQDQFEELIEVAEKVSGKKMNEQRLKEVSAEALKASNLWGECLAMGQTKPSPWTGFDGFFHMAPVVTLRGHKVCTDYYRLLLDELKDRVAKGIGGIKNEKYRLMWDNLPIWFSVREMSNLLAENGFNFVAATYTDAWAAAGKRIDPDDPVGSAAKTYQHIILNQDLNNRLDLMTTMAKEYAVDGAVLHSDRSCKPYSMGQIDLRERLASDAGIKALILEADHNDPRSYSREQAENRLAAFMESFG
jgi:benzoyl-CoA reductase/2-hydroxyglutaryl-CoA dehydratase subunit BcrC/BadD/HgdB